MLPLTRNEAIRVSSSRFNWVTETPNRAGSMRRPTRRTPSSRGAKVKRGSSPSRSRNGNWNRNWTTPAMKTPQARATMGLSISGASQSAQPISERLSSTGVKAGTPKRLWALSMPPAKAVREMNSR